MVTWEEVGGLHRFEMRIERGHVVGIARATGAMGPVHHDPEAARRAGHPDVVAPPTFLFTLAFRYGDPWSWATAAGIDMARALHGEQSFELFAPVHAGDLLEVAREAGPLEVTGSGVRRCRCRTELRRDGVLVARLETELVVPRP